MVSDYGGQRKSGDNKEPNKEVESTRAGQKGGSYI